MRLAQITDCHFTAVPGERLHGIDVDATLARVIELLKSWGPERLLVTGDLSEHGDPASYRRLGRVLNEIGVTVNVIPGNHDVKHNLNRYLGTGQDGAPQKIICGDWDLLMLDTAMADNPAGRLGPAQLDWLADSLGQSRQRPKLIFMHHHPLPIGDDWLDCMGLMDRQELWRVLADDESVKAVICGHIHQVRDVEHQGIRFISTPSTCSQARPGETGFVDDELGPGFRWFELEDGGHWQTGVIRTPESAMAISGG